MPSTFWLETTGGIRRRVDAGGVTLGRSPRCDVVLSDVRASRVQAIAHLTPQGPRLVQLGRGETRVNGAPVERERDLATSDVIDVPGLALTLVAEERSSPETRAASAWVVERADGGLFGVSHSPFLIGGSRDDDLRVDGWADHAVELRQVSGVLHVKASAPIEVDGVTVSPGVARPLDRGSTIASGRERFTLVAGGSLGEGSTLRGASVTRRIVLEFLPRGGRLSVSGAGAESSVYLPDRRCDLAAVLLAARRGAHAGEFVPDEIVLARVWGKEPKDRTDLNVLVHRLRKDLARAGLEAGLVERAEGGGATRFVIGEGTLVELI